MYVYVCACAHVYVCVWVCIYVYALCMCVHVYACVCECVASKLMLGVFLEWHKVLQLNSELVNSAGLDAQFAPGIPCFCLPHTGITDGILYVNAENWILVLRPLEQVGCPLSHLSSWQTCQYLRLDCWVCAVQCARREGRVSDGQPELFRALPHSSPLLCLPRNFLLVTPRCPAGRALVFPSCKWKKRDKGTKGDRPSLLHGFRAVRSTC